MTYIPRPGPALVLLLALGSPLSAQTVADSGTFVVRHSGDTIATETFARNAGTIRGTLAIRNQQNTSQRYTAVLGPDATVAMIEVAVRQDLDSGRVKGKVMERARVIFKEDSAAVDEMNKEGIETRVFGTERGAIPYLNMSFALLEQAVRRARAPGAPGDRVPFFNLGGGQTLSARLQPVGPDSLALELGNVEYRLRIDDQGRVLGAAIPSQNVLVDRR